MVSSCKIIDAVIYGVMLRAKMVKLPKAPPENISNRPNRPLSLAWNAAAKISRLIPGTGMHDPSRNTTNIISVYKSFLRISGILQA